MGIFAAMGKLVANGLIDSFTTRTLKDNYLENLFQMYNTEAKSGPFHQMANLMRAINGRFEAAQGSPLPLSPWDKLLFNPVSLVRLPTADERKVDTRVVIGPAARSPLEVEIPLLITGMSYGTALNAKAKVALAKGATMAGTATNTGESFLPAEREAVGKLVVQYHRGNWPQKEDKREFLQRADMIEIQLSQGAQGAAPLSTPPGKIDERMRETFGMEKGEATFTSSRLAGVDSPEDFRRLVKKLQENYQVPVGVKIAASHWLEAEIELFLEAGVHFIVVDGAEGGTHGGPPILQDDLGLPTLHAVVRARRSLEARGFGGKVSLIAAGGLHSPGYCLKALALGADAVYLGSTALIALFSKQIHPGLYYSRRKDGIKVDLGGESVKNFLLASVAVMELAARAMDKTALAQVGSSELVTLDPFVARISGVPLIVREPPPVANWT